MLLVHVGNANVLALEIEPQESIRTPELTDKFISRLIKEAVQEFNKLIAQFLIRWIARLDVKLLEIETYALKVLLVLQTVDVVLANDAWDVRERIIWTVDDSRRAFTAQDRLIALGTPVVFAVFFADEI